MSLVVLAPFRHRRQLFIPVLVAVVGFFIGFVLVAPLSCTVTGRIVNTQNGGANTESSPSTTCTSGAGIEYSGGGDYDPPQLPGAIAGTALASVLGGLSVLIQRSRSPRNHTATLGWTGVAVHAAWTLFLAGQGLFSDGTLDPQWRTALVFVCLAALPGAFAVVGLRGRPALVLTAGIMCIPLAFISLAGATLPLLLPAAVYLMAYARS